MYVVIIICKVISYFVLIDLQSLMQHKSCLQGNYNFYNLNTTVYGCVNKQIKYIYIYIYIYICLSKMLLKFSRIKQTFSMRIRGYINSSTDLRR